MKVTIQHLHSAPTWTGRRGFCHNGARQFCARHGLDWPAFVRDGFDEEVLIATRDPMALRLVEHAREVGDGQQ